MTDKLARGIWPALVTPFTDDGTALAADRVEPLIRHLLDAIFRRYDRFDEWVDDRSGVPVCAPQAESSWPPQAVRLCGRPGRSPP